MKAEKKKMPKPLDISIKTENPEEADRILQGFGVLMEGGGKDNNSNYVKDKNGNYKARCFGDVKFVKFAIENQGYNFMEIIQ